MRYYRVIVHRGEPEEGGFWAEVEGLPGIVASADTLDELDRDIHLAVEDYIESQAAHGHPVPEGLTAPSESWRWDIAVA